MTRRPAIGEVARSFAVLLAVSGLAVAQPLLDVFGASPETFVFADADSTTIIMFGVLVVLVPALVALGIEVVAGLIRPEARRTVHVGLVGLFAAAWVVQVLRQAVSWPSVVLVVLALVAAAGLVTAYLRNPSVRSALSYLAIAPVLFLGLFLFASPTSDLIFVGDTETVGEIESTTPIVLVVLDELPLSTLLGPDGDIDADLFPNFAAFAEESTWYRNATTTQGLTAQAVPTILSGQDVGTAGPDGLASEYPDNIFTLFGGSYDLNVSEPATRLCAPSLCEASTDSPTARSITELLGDARAVWVDRVTGTERDDLLDQFAEETEPVESEPAPGGETAPSSPESGEELVGASPQRFDDFLADIGDLPERSLSVIHLVLPHSPYTFLPSGHTYEEPGAEATGSLFAWPEGFDWPPLLGRQRHVLQAQYTDGLLGRLLDQLRATDGYQDAVVAVTADHGVNFSPGELSRAVDESHPEQVMWIPMLIKAPGQVDGAVDESDVRTLDVLPTIAELAGVDIPFEVDGQSVVGGSDRTSDTKPFFQVNSPPFVTGPSRRFDFPIDVGSRDVRARNYPSLRQGDPAWWPYQVGELGDLLGEAVADLTVGEPAEATVTVDDAQLDALGDVDLDGPSRPVFLGGGVEGAVDAHIAVAVNGRIAGVSAVFENFNEAPRFAIMIPEMLLESGENDVVLFLVESDAAGTDVLRPING